MTPDTLRCHAAARINFTILIIAASAGAASLAWPFDFIFTPGAPLWGLQLLSLATLVWMIHRCGSWQQALLRGWLFATCWLCATFWWLFVSMHTYAGLNAMLAVLAIVLLAAALAVYYGAGCGLYYCLRTRRPGLASVVFAALWTLAEMARGTWLTGFGWGAIAYAHVDGPLAGYASWIGAYGMGAWAAWLAAACVCFIQGSTVQRSILASAAGIVLLAAAYLPHVSWSAGTISVRLLQGNIPQDEKFRPGSGVPIALQWYGEQLQHDDVDLIVAPETAIPVLPQELPPDYWNTLKDRFTRGTQAALIGIPLGDAAQGYTNSVVGLAPQQHAQAMVWRYDKHHLVPFGEFIPPLFKWFTRLMHIPLGDFNRGAVGQASFAWKGQRLAPNICYEDLFGEELGARFIHPATAPSIFVNVSNIGWFGNTVAIDQHLHISRMRALEFERPMVRATNTGATVIIDHTGQVTHALARHTRGVLSGDVQGREGITPYAWWVARWGLWPLWIAAVALVVAVVCPCRIRACLHFNTSS